MWKKSWTDTVMSSSMSALIFDLSAPVSESLYWDASFLVHAVYQAGRYHRECYAFLERLSNSQNTLSYVSTLTIDETIFTLIQLKVLEDHPGEGFWEVYRRDPQIIQRYMGELRLLVERLSVDPRIQLVGTEQGDLAAMMDYMDRYACLPRDAMHLAVMARLGISSIVTTDDDFAPVEGLRLLTCNSRVLSRN